MIRKLDRTISYVVLNVAAVIALVPFLGVITLSLGVPGQVGSTLSLTNATHWRNFISVWQKGGFGSSMRTSTIITVIVVVGSVVLSVPAGYALALMRFRGRTVTFLIFVFGLLIPLEAMIIPLYFDLRRLGLADNYWSVILPDIGFSVAFGAFWMRAFFLTSSRTLLEAAKIDGANSFQTLIRILMPLARPQILTLTVLFFVWNWNDFLLPLVMLSGSSLQTAPMSLVFFQGQHTTDYTYLAAASLITIVPVIIVYVSLQRSFTQGILEGGVKG